VSVAPIAAAARNPRLLPRLRRNSALVAGLGLLTLLLLAALIGPAVSSSSSLDTNNAILTGPSASHLFGTDAVGRDILVRVLKAIRLDLGLAVAICALGTFAGLLVGLVAGYVGGLLDLVIMRLVDIAMSLPAFILALITAIVLGNNARTMIFAIALAYTPVMTRVVRSQVVSLRELPMVETSRAIGTPGWRIVLWHMLPNTFSVVTAQATLFLAWAILDTAAMSFIGVGVRPPTPELGAMISDGVQYIVSGQWWIATFPGIFIVLLVVSFNAIGDAMRDVLDPRSRR
jgi:peptide/nickel transport system permease protein